MDNYKNYLTLTSQLFFCATPIRLDSYNQCQFGCVYCFSRNRKGEHAETQVKSASHEKLEKRLCRVAKGELNAGLDEFLERRVPLQLGGLHDPFTAHEFKNQTTLHLLKVLNEHQYPTLISTKGRLFMSPEYAKVLKKMNVHVRLSAAGVAEPFRKGIDIGCDSFEETCNKIKFIRALGLTDSLRIQPVIPGFEADALEMTMLAAAAGVNHISFEYLKITAESKDRELKRIKNVTGVDVWQIMEEAGMTIVGRDYTLHKDSKVNFLRSARKLCRELKIKFGAGDTEFIHLSDGNGCCNSSEYFLRDANQFRYNFTGVLSSKKKRSEISFDDFTEEWMPRMNIHHYLTTNSRTRVIKKGFSSLQGLLAHRWNGGKGPYSPAFFYGVQWDGKIDKKGYKAYQFESPW